MTLTSTSEFTKSVPTAAQTIDEEDGIATLLKKRAIEKRKKMELFDKVVSTVSKQDIHIDHLGNGFEMEVEEVVC
jgi:F0F1-type ATP synthase delta subunit